MTYKSLLVGLLCVCTTFLTAQNKKKKRVIPEPTTVEGCQFEEDVYKCSEKKLQQATFQFLTASDYTNVANKTSKDSIFVYMRLATNKTGKVVKKHSSLKFYESEMMPLRVEPTTPIEDFQIELASISKKQNSYIATYLYLKIDRDKNEFIPLFDYVPERIPFDGPEVGVIYPGCRKAKTNEERKRCMSAKISEFIGRHFDTQLGNKLGLIGLQKIYVTFKINLQGKAVEIEVKAPHPRLAEEAIRVVKKLPKMKPGTVDGVPVNVMYNLPIFFKVEKETAKRGKRG